MTGLLCCNTYQDKVLNLPSVVTVSLPVKSKYTCSIIKQSHSDEEEEEEDDDDDDDDNNNNNSSSKRTDVRIYDTKAHRGKED
jgi:hypothetical protein